MVQSAGVLCEWREQLTEYNKSLISEIKELKREKEVFKLILTRIHIIIKFRVHILE